MMVKRTRLLLGLIISLLAVIGSGCSDDSTKPVPGVEPEIVNNTDAFSFQVTSVQNFSGTREYTWSNTGTMANVDQSAAITGGQITLTLLDADGTDVYSRDLSEDGSFSSSAGTSGDWTVRVVFTGMSGTFNFSVEMRTP